MIFNHKDFREAAPEKFNWALCDSVKLSALAETLARRCSEDLKTSARNYVPGLRAALVEIAKISTI